MLVEEAIHVLSRLQTAESAKNGVELAQELHELRNELAQKVDALEALSVRARLFRAKKVAVTSIPDPGNLKKTVSELAARFREGATPATLKKGKRWTAVLTTLETLAKSVRSQQIEDWRLFHSTQLFAGPPPEKVRARVAMTRHNRESLERYSQLYKHFSSYRGALPEDAETIEGARKTSDALEKIKFEENVPQEVAQFLDSTASSLGASLELLTPAVIKWLRDNNLLSTYVVRSRVS